MLSHALFRPDNGLGIKGQHLHKTRQLINAPLCLSLRINAGQPGFGSLVHINNDHFRVNTDHQLLDGGKDGLEVALITRFFPAQLFIFLEHGVLLEGQAGGT